MDQQGKVVMITGAAHGIGAACAREFQRRGAQLSLIDIEPDWEARKQAGAIHIQGDVCSEPFQMAAVARTLEQFGAIDVLVNNVGVGLYASASRSPVDLVRRMFDVNVMSAVGMTRLVVPHMRDRGAGALVNITSIGALVSLPWATLYCASKSAMYSYSEGLRREVAADNIHVMTVVPGIVRTGFRKRVLGGSVPNGVERLRAGISPDDLARAIADGVSKRRPMLIKPWIGRVFASVGYVLPGVMDWYLQRCWQEELRSMAGQNEPVS